MNSLIQIHKLNNPIRPLINFKKAPTYKIAKIIDVYKRQLSRDAENKFSDRPSTYQFFFVPTGILFYSAHTVLAVCGNILYFIWHMLFELSC